MNLAEALRAEISRRALPLSRLAEQAGIPYSTLRDFVASGAGLSIDRASELAKYLGLELTVSKLRKEEMKMYIKQIAELERKGHDFDEESVVAAQEMVDNIQSLESHGWTCTEDEAALLANMVANVQWLAENGWAEVGEDDADSISRFRQDVEWLQENDWSADEDEVKTVSSFVADLQWLEQRGEEATAERIEEVAEFVANLKRNRK